MAIVNAHFAKHYWPGGDAVGKRIRLESSSGTPVEIVGVAQTIKYQTMSDPMDFVYMPLAQHPVARMVLMLRSSGDPLQLVQPVKDAVRSMDANLPLLHTQAYGEFYLNEAVRGPQIAIDLVGAMGAVGLLLAIAGLYGLVAYNVSRRTHEIGIRMALGAGRSEIFRLVVGQGMALALIGLLVGLPLALGMGRAVSRLLYGVAPNDFATFAGVAVVLAGVALVACYIPARRAMRVDPMVALRHE